jgi:modulator of FtsH protease HflC
VDRRSDNASEPIRETTAGATAPAQHKVRRTFALLALGLLAWAVSASFFTVDVTEYALVSRFGAIVRVAAEPGLGLKAPFDRVIRLTKRLAYSQPATAEFLTVDKKNVVVDSLAVWRIADPQQFARVLATRASADACIADTVLGEMGAVVGRYPAAALVSADAAASRFRQVVAEVREPIARAVRAAYGIEIVDVDIRRLSLPEQNKEHVFDRMKAERGKMAKEHRSAGELESKRIIAEADRERSHIEWQAFAEAQRLRAEGDAEAARVYAQAFGQNPKFYKFQRTLQGYEKFLDENTTLFLPAEAKVLEMLRPQTPTEPGTAKPGATGANALIARPGAAGRAASRAKASEPRPHTATSDLIINKSPARSP